MDVNLENFLLQEQSKVPVATGPTGDLTQLLNCIATAVKAISMAIKRTGQQHIKGYELEQLDGLANEIFINTLKGSRKVCAMVSEEKLIQVEAENQGRYVVFFDPLDVSSSAHGALSVGSIFGIAKKSDHVKGESVRTSEIAWSGRRNVASGYVLYGSRTHMVLTTGSGVNGFTLDRYTGKFNLTDPDMKITLNGYGEYAKIIAQPHFGYLSNVKDPSVYRDHHGARTSVHRYIGSMIADIHRMIKQGGVFTYPPPAASPQDKPRLLYELNPMAHIVEQAGGLASNDDRKNILDIRPDDLHDRQPVMMGSKTDMLKYFDLMSENQVKHDHFMNMYRSFDVQFEDED